MQRRRAMVIGATAVFLLASVAAAAWFVGGRDRAGGTGSDAADADPAFVAAEDFARAWTQGKLAEAPVTAGSGDVAAKTAEITAALGTAELRPTVAVRAVERGETGDQAVAELDVTWPLDEGRAWSYTTRIGLTTLPDDGTPTSDAPDGGGDRWRVAWSPAVVHPELAEGERLALVRQPAKRGTIVALDGSELVADRPVVIVGIRADQTTDRASAAQAVASAVGVDAGALAQRVRDAGPDEVVDVITLRAEAFEEVRTALDQVSGVVLTEATLPLAPTRDFARALIGTVGPATAELAASSEGRIVEGEPTGLSGIQAAQDEVLAGSPGLSIQVVPAAPEAAPRELQAFPPVAGRSVTVTLDRTVQQVADEVIATAPGPAALVAIRVSTGDVVAVANGPAGANGFNRAMVGRYPPGSVFKVASALALVDRGVTPESVISCPATIVVGKEFVNAGGFALGEVPFRTDFARSCNTAFVSQAELVSDDALASTAEALGYRALELGAPAYGGSVPLTDDEAEHASNLIGQGKVTASPLSVALASASVAAGRRVEPRLVVDPGAPTPPLGPELEGAATVRELMRAVVTDGTGSALAGVPGGEVFGKTGTAEYGTEDPPATHAWFTGFQGDLAFAVLVEDASSGGAVAAPLAAQFLTELAGR